MKGWGMKTEDRGVGMAEAEDARQQGKRTEN